MNHPNGEIIRRDLSTTMLPLITDDWDATRIESSRLSPAHRSYLSVSDALIEELQAADTIVIGAPMYNFAISSPLKGWIDQIVRIGKTVSYGPHGPQGLLENKNVVVITARGGSYEKGTPREKWDFQELYLRHIFGFLGLTDVTLIHAENQMREEAGGLSVASALEQIGRLAARQSHQVAY
jgi:FMN-dependent NADH-azoreductase